MLQSAILAAGRQLSRETELELSTLLSATFVRLGQEALNTRDYAAVEQSMASLQRIETQQPMVAKDIRPRISVQNRLRDFVAEASRNGMPPQGLSDVLRRTPKPAAEELALQFSKAVTKDECTRFVNVLMQLGNDATGHLRDMFLKRTVQESLQSLALLSRIDMPLLLSEIPSRMGLWNRQQQDTAVRMIAMAGSEARGELLMSMLDYLDPLILPLALDEIGFTGENLPALKLTDMASGGGKAASVPYLQVKSIEALARLRMRSAEPLMTEIRVGAQIPVVDASARVAGCSSTGTRDVESHSCRRSDSEMRPLAARAHHEASGWHRQVLGPAAALSARLAGDCAERDGRQFQRKDCGVPLRLKSRRRSCHQAKPLTIGHGRDARNASRHADAA